ncbi:hypothetical protein D3C71_1041790 [compost metagenome]
MQCMRGNFLAGAGFAGDQHRQVDRGELAQRGAHHQHHLALAQQRVEHIVVGQRQGRIAQRLQLTQQLLDIRRMRELLPAGGKQRVRRTRVVFTRSGGEGKQRHVPMLGGELTDALQLVVRAGPEINQADHHIAAAHADVGGLLG